MNTNEHTAGLEGGAEKTEAFFRTRRALGRVCLTKTDVIMDFFAKEFEDCFGEPPTDEELMFAKCTLKMIGLPAVAGGYRAD